MPVTVVDGVAALPKVLDCATFTSMMPYSVTLEACWALAVAAKAVSTAPTTCAVNSWIAPSAPTNRGV